MDAANLAFGRAETAGFIAVAARLVPMGTGAVVPIAGLCARAMVNLDGTVFVLDAALETRPIAAVPTGQQRSAAFEATTFVAPNIKVTWLGDHMLTTWNGLLKLDIAQDLGEVLMLIA